jgi:hypothetical protein
VALVFSGIGYLGFSHHAFLLRLIAVFQVTCAAYFHHSGVDILVNSSSGAVSIRTQPNLPQLAGALNAFQATFRLTSPSAPQLYVDLDVLTFLQRARAVPSTPNASSSTSTVSLDAAARVPVFPGQLHEVTFRSTSTLSDTVSFDFTGAIRRHARGCWPTRLRRSAL